MLMSTNSTNQCVASTLLKVIGYEYKFDTDTMHNILDDFFLAVTLTERSSLPVVMAQSDKRYAKESFCVEWYDKYRAQFHTSKVSTANLASLSLLLDNLLLINKQSIIS